MKNKISFWQISLPLAGVLIFIIGAITAVNISNGRYFFHLEVNPSKVVITTDVDKRQKRPAGSKIQRQMDANKIRETGLDTVK